MNKPGELVYWSHYSMYRKWDLYLAATHRGLCCLTLPNESFYTLNAWVSKHISGATLIEDHSKLAIYKEQLDEYFHDGRKEFTLPLDFRGTAFQLSVWNALIRIPYGETRSYSEIAEQVNSPKAVRAVGAANGKNPIPIVVPCHRVIGNNGTLTGFRGGLSIKEVLLRMEGLY
jgi:methylated-DNA-[protein]-cysteine S-methyltransferase